MHPSSWLRLWFGIREPVTRSQYVAGGVGLALFKYAVEAAVILAFTGNWLTPLEGRTWYTFDMHPQAYWTLWSDLSIHRIHRRVLDHFKRLAEAQPSPAIPAGGER